jgi:hypothetical protein
VDPDQQLKYRSAVGTLLQFVKHSRPDIANPVRELSKCMDKVTEAAYKEMLRVVKFVLDTRNFGYFFDLHRLIKMPHGVSRSILIQIWLEIRKIVAVSQV